MPIITNLMWASQKTVLRTQAMRGKEGSKNYEKIDYIISIYSNPLQNIFSNTSANGRGWYKYKKDFPRRDTEATAKTGKVINRAHA